MEADTWHLVLALSLIALFVYLVWHYYYYGSTYTGLTSYPFVGILPELTWHYSSLFDYLTGLLQKSSNMAIFGALPGVKWIFTANPKHIEYILKDNFRNYPKGESFSEMVSELFGKGIFATDGEEWRQQRKIASHEFSSNSLRRMMMVSIQDEVQHRLIPFLEAKAGTGEGVDMQEVFLRYTFDNICRIGFGVDPGALSQKLPELPFARSFDRATRLTSLRFLMPRLVWKGLRAMNWGIERQLKRDVEVLDSFAQHVINRRRQTLTVEPSDASDASQGSVQSSGLLSRPLDASNDSHSFEQSSDLLSRMIALGERDHHQLFTDRFLRDACLNFVIAGRDTSALALSWLFWLLSQHPRVEEKIVEELRAIKSRREAEPGHNVGDSINSNQRSNGTERGDNVGVSIDSKAREAEPRAKEALFTFDELKAMTYTHAAINEALRLYPSVPVDIKVALEDDMLPDKTRIGKGWRVAYCIYSLGRMTSVWGPNASEFKPERWITDQGLLKVESPFKFVAFNAGPRLCLGREMAYLQMKSVVGSVLPRYQFRAVPDHTVHYTTSITLFMKHGLLMTVEPRKDHI